MSALVLIYFVGLLISIFVFRSRAGLGIAHGVRIMGTDGVGLGYFLLQVAKATIWPGLLVYWLLNDRPEPRTLFNEKAQEAEARMRMKRDT